MLSAGSCMECTLCGWMGNGECPTHGRSHMIWDEENDHEPVERDFYGENHEVEEDFSEET